MCYIAVSEISFIDIFNLIFSVMEKSIIKSGKKYQRVASSHVAYSAEDLEKLRKEFNALKCKLLTDEHFSEAEHKDYDRMKQILAHYGMKI